MGQKLCGVRFAPSPTGVFHVGNLRTAWISYQIANAMGQPWVLRFEDIDKSRLIVGAAEKQLADMKSLGLTPSEIIYQSDFENRHWDVFARGVEERMIYPCFCTSKEVRSAIAASASAAHGPEQALYSGHCRELKEPVHDLVSVGWRFRNANPSGHDDFIVARTGGGFKLGNVPPRDAFQPSYQLACAIDDCDGHYALLVRAWDLEPAAMIQRTLQKWIAPDAEAPSVFHTSLIVTDLGKRLGKRDKDITLDEMIARGLTPQKIVAAFEKSFIPVKSLPARESLSGEPIRELTLSRLFSGVIQADRR